MLGELILYLSISLYCIYEGLQESKASDQLGICIEQREISQDDRNYMNFIATIDKHISKLGTAYIIIFPIILL